MQHMCGLLLDKTQNPTAVLKQLRDGGFLSSSSFPLALFDSASQYVDTSSSFANSETSVKLTFADYSNCCCNVTKQSPTKKEIQYLRL